MLILILTLIVVLVPGAAAWFVVRRWPQRDPMAPAIDASVVRHEVQRHPRLRAIAMMRTSPESITGLALTTAAALAVGGAVVVGLLLLMVHTNTGLARLDHSASLFGARHATSLSTHVLRWYTQLGGALVIVPLALVVGIVETLRQRTASVFLFLTLVVGGQFLVANVTKSIVGRVRPNLDRLTGFSGPSFPSGHAVASAACLAAFALVIGRSRSLKVRALLAGLAVGLATGIAFTRVMLGVHWLTDVLAGLAMGWGWFALCSIALGGRRLRFGLPEQVAREESTQ